MRTKMTATTTTATDDIRELASDEVAAISGAAPRVTTTVHKFGPFEFVTWTNGQGGCWMLWGDDVGKIAGGCAV